MSVLKSIGSKRKLLFEGKWRILALLSASACLWIVINSGVFRRYHLPFEGLVPPPSLKPMLRHLNKYLKRKSSKSQYAACAGDTLRFQGSDTEFNGKDLAEKLQKAPKDSSTAETSELGQLFFQATVLSAPCA